VSTNLLAETLHTLEQNGKSPLIVNWVGSLDGKYAISFAGFRLIANVNYDAGFGAQEVAVNLVVVGDDWWLERHEYDGSEWWEFKSIPKAQADAKHFDKVVGNYWPSIEQVNDPSDDHHAIPTEDGLS
jgi:hypothetical protein